MFGLEPCHPCLSSPPAYLPLLEVAELVISNAEYSMLLFNQRCAIYSPGILSLPGSLQDCLLSAILYFHSCFHDLGSAALDFSQAPAQRAVFRIRNYLFEHFSVSALHHASQGHRRVGSLARAGHDLLGLDR